jgi:hypothetical protein
MIARLLGWIKGLPIAKYLKPVWKFGLNVAVQDFGDTAQKLADAEIAKDVSAAGAKAVDIVNKAADKACAFVDSLAFLPEPARAKVHQMLCDGLVQLRVKLEQAGQAGSAGAVQDAFDSAFDAFQADLAAKIDAL